MAKRPAEQWYTGDYYRAVDLQKCCAATRGIWRDALDAMVNEQIRGKIKGSREELCRLLRCTGKELQRFIDDNKRHRFADIKVRKGVIIIICRRLYREWLSDSSNVRRQRRFREKGGGDPERWTAIRVLILQRDKYSCAYCGQKAKTVDHIVPRSKGGGERASNLVACCTRCNLRKNNRSLEEAGMSFWKNYDTKLLQKKTDIVAEMLKKCSVFEERKPPALANNKDMNEIKCNSNGKVTLYTSTSTSFSKEKEYKEKEIFNKYWEAYPRKDAKQRAVNWFKKYQPTESDVGKMVFTIERQKKKGQRLGCERQFMPLPETWLNDGDWQDAPTKEDTEKQTQEDMAAEQKALKRKRNEIRKDESGYYQEKTIDELKAMLKDKRNIARFWLIKEILSER